jgi:hypothetical protein
MAFRTAVREFLDAGQDAAARATMLTIPPPQA